jgi:hypothetical protein
MKKEPRPAKAERNSAGDQLSFQPVVDFFATQRGIGRETRKGFGSGALKVNGKIFAMMDSKGQFVVKLPKARVDELVSSGLGERFEPGPGRVMQEWVAVGVGQADWVELAKEAHRFVKRGK